MSVCLHACGWFDKSAAGCVADKNRPASNIPFAEPITHNCFNRAPVKNGGQQEEQAGPKTCLAVCYSQDAKHTQRQGQGQGQRFKEKQRPRRYRSSAVKLLRDDKLILDEKQARSPQQSKQQTNKKKLNENFSVKYAQPHAHELVVRCLW